MKRKEVVSMLDRLRLSSASPSHSETIEQVCQLVEDFMRYANKAEQALDAADKLMSATRDVRGADNVALREHLPKLITKAGQCADIYDAQRRALRGIA